MAQPVIFQLYDGIKANLHSVETVRQVFNFDLFLG